MCWSNYDMTTKQLPLLFLHKLCCDINAREIILYLLYVISAVTNALTKRGDTNGCLCCV